MFNKNTVLVIWKVLIVNSLVVGTAHAYLDPGAGSALIQGVLAAIAGIIVAGKLYWHRLLRLLGIRKSTDESTYKTVTKDQGKCKDSSDV